MSARAAFDPQTLQIMQFAHERACKLLDIRDKSDPMAEIIAKEIIRGWQAAASASHNACLGSS